MASMKKFKIIIVLACLSKFSHALEEKILSHDYLDNASVVGSMVDDFKNNDELLSTRILVNEDSTDQCFDFEKSPENFSEQISYYVSQMLEDTQAFVGGVGSYYGTSSNNDAYYPVSLMSHPLCEVNTQTLAKTISNTKIPDNLTIERINRFSKTTNDLRIEAKNGDIVAKKKILEKWSRFYSCLSYVESLSSADSEKSNQVAKKYASENYRKPAGVKFYEDPYQNESSKLNIGLFQFTPNLANNISPCVKAWNQIHQNKTHCQINSKLTNKEVINVVGSSLQSFNTFCGVHKMIQTFSIQVNTNKTSATHPNNFFNGKLKSADLRCVSPHFQSGKAYVHFGPFMNSTGKNLGELFTCIENSDR